MNAQRPVGVWSISSRFAHDLVYGGIGLAEVAVYTSPPMDDGSRHLQELLRMGWPGRCKPSPAILRFGW
jgi:hypothetical protein